MWRWMAVLVISASSAGAEQWADEPGEQPAAEATEPPLVGLIAGGELVASGVINDGPGLGLRLGVRFAVAQHLSLGLLLDWESAILAPEGSGPNELLHGASALALLEVFSRSAFERLLVPELSAGVLVGSVVSLSAAGTRVGGAAGAPPRDDAAAALGVVVPVLRECPLRLRRAGRGRTAGGGGRALTEMSVG